MSAAGCERIALADLVDYSAGELSTGEAAAIEEHLFTCADCASRVAEFNALTRAVRSAVTSADVGGFVTDAVLNQLARDGIRMRTFALSPGSVVPCAVWDDDELMMLRLRGDFTAGSEVTMSQRIAGTEVIRATGHVAASPYGEILYALPAALVRQMPVVEVEILITTHDGERERPIASYRLLHGGELRR